MCWEQTSYNFISFTEEDLGFLLDNTWSINQERACGKGSLWQGLL